MADRSRALAGRLLPRVPDRRRRRPRRCPRQAAEPHTDPDDRRPRANVTVNLGNVDARRGSRLQLSGRIETSGAPCAEARVDLFLDPKAGTAKERIPLGTLVTNADGRFDGRVVVPYAVPPGDYDVRATTPGNLACGEGVEVCLINKARP